MVKRARTKSQTDRKPAKSRATRKRVTPAKERSCEAGPFIEVVNWRKAQPKMRGAGNTWCKLYVSLLDCDQFEGLDDASRVLIIALWMFAARSGRHVFPADPKWLHKKIPMLNSEPDLRPLIEAKNAYGEPRPFLRYCEAPAAAGDAGNSQEEQQTERATKGSRARARAREEKREERERTKPLRVSGKREKRKNRVSSTPQNSTGEQTSTEPERPEQTQTQPPTGPEEHESTKPVSPTNPMESEAGEPAGVQTSKAPRPALRHTDTHVLGKIPIWWSDPACVRFSYELFEALGLKARWDPESRRGKDERGVFAAWLFAARAQTPMHRWQELEEHAISLARDIAKYGKSARSPGAVWRSKVQPQCQSAPSHASPKAAAG